MDIVIQLKLHCVFEWSLLVGGLYCGAIVWPSGFFTATLKKAISGYLYSVVVQFLQRRSSDLQLGGIYKLPLTSWSRGLGTSKVSLFS